MKILTVDVGTGTQDIFLYDSRIDIENGFKLIVPSPTMIVHYRLRKATERGEAVLLTGVTMGGGPSQWAAEQHVGAGFDIYATPGAARSFNDDLAAVETMGIKVVSEDEASQLPQEIVRLELKDFDFNTIVRAFKHFDVQLNDLAAVAVAVFDHGDAPAGYSDRQFRFDYLDKRIRTQNRLSAFAFQADEIPEIMTRLQAVAKSASDIDVPLIVMDTAPAAVLGAMYDPLVGERERVMIANVGNFHTLAFRLGPDGIEGMFEHHTGLIDCVKLDKLLRAFAQSSLQHDDVFSEHGHGALIYDPEPLPLDESGYGVAVTGPRRSLMQTSTLRPYFAVPFGDMMISGCFGLLAAVADIRPDLGEPIQASLQGGGGSGRTPWDIEE